ncbi:MAG: chemotaxis protein CheW [Nitrospirae bacterium]|nr:chemotaxis protein CheW [Nitrospirota bacterium]
MDKARAEEQVIIFLLKGEKFGLNIKNLISISEPGELKEERGEGVYRGRLSVRSKEAPVINLNMLLQLGEGNFSDNVKILVLGNPNKMIGLIVDAVLEVISFSPKAIRPLPKMIMDSSITYFTGVGRVNGEAVLFLNESEIISASYAGKA